MNVYMAFEYVYEYVSMIVAFIPLKEETGREPVVGEDGVLIYHYLTCVHFGGRDRREPEEGKIMLLIYIYNYIFWRKGPGKPVVGEDGVFCYEFIYILKEGTG